MKLTRALATVGGLGDFLPAPGTTVGSVAGVVLFAAAWHLSGGLVPWVPLAGACLLAVVAVPSCGREAARRGHGDPGAVVLDETAGQWVALAMWTLGHPDTLTPGALVASFLLFRLFDVVKPWPIRRLERLPGGWGIVADDLAAGVAAGGAHLLLAALWP